MFWACTCATMRGAAMRCRRGHGVAGPASAAMPLCRCPRQHRQPVALPEADPPVAAVESVEPDGSARLPVRQRRSGPGHVLDAWRPRRRRTRPTSSAANRSCSMHEDLAPYPMMYREPRSGPRQSCTGPRPLPDGSIEGRDQASTVRAGANDVHRRPLIRSSTAPDRSKAPSRRAGLATRAALRRRRPTTCPLAWR